jgi:ribonuclease HI
MPLLEGATDPQFAVSASAGGTWVRKQVTIVCDGSSLGNGGGAARAAAVAILEYKDATGRSHRRAVGEYLGTGTNNQAEIVAACIGLEALREPCDVKLITDSKYVVETLKGNFRRKMNHDFWERLDRASAKHRVTWEWTRGHAGHPTQERCDRAAREIAAAGAVDSVVLAEAAAQ